MAKLLTASLKLFYQDPGNAATLASFVDGTAQVSLRLVDWYTTAYIVTEDRALHLRFMNRQCAFGRKLFDPFRRTHRIVLDYGDRTFETTLGQMNFFKWMIEEGVYEAIVADRERLGAIMLEGKVVPPDKQPRKARGVVPYRAPEGARSTTIRF